MKIPFSRLKFYNLDSRTVRAVIFMPNNYGAMITQGLTRRSTFTGYRTDDTYEVTVLAALKPHAKGILGKDSDVVFDTPVADGDLHHQTRDDVERVLGEIAALRPRPYELGEDIFLRYSGNAKIIVEIDDSSRRYESGRQNYIVTITQGRNRSSSPISAPIRYAAIDSLEMIDDVARSALSFATLDGEIDENGLDFDDEGWAVTQ